METFIRNAAYEHEVIGEWFPFYNWEEGKPKTATLLNPELVEVKSVLGKDLIYLRPSSDIKYILNSNREGIDKLKQFIPKEFLKSWKKSEPVLLNEESTGHYTNLKPYHQKHARPPIEPIFADLEILRTLQEADYATAKKLKQLLLQVKVGNENFNEGNPVDKSLINKARSMWNNPSQSMEIFTQWFVDAEYIIPDTEIFNNEKYESVVKRIIDWSGLNVMIESGGSYSQGFLKIKGLKQSVKNTRKIIRKALNDFNRRIANKNGKTYYGKAKIPKIKFDNNALKDDKEIRQIVQFLYKHGLLSIDDTLDTFNYDFDKQIKKKKDEEQYDDLIKIPFEPSQGLILDNDSENSDKPRNPDDGSQPRSD